MFLLFLFLPNNCYVSSSSSKFLLLRIKQSKLSKMGCWRLYLVVFKNLTLFSFSSKDFLSFFSDLQEWALSSSVIQEYSYTFNIVRLWRSFKSGEYDCSWSLYKLEKQKYSAFVCINWQFFRPWGKQCPFFPPLPKEVSWIELCTLEIEKCFDVIIPWHNL